MIEGLFAVGQQLKHVSTNVILSNRLYIDVIIEGRFAIGLQHPRIYFSLHLIYFNFLFYHTKT